MVSPKSIGQEFADSCINDYLEGILLTNSIEKLKREGIALLTKRHPKDDGSGSQKLWRSKLLWKILRK